MPPPSPVEERLPRPELLRQSADYRTCYKGGARRHGPFAVLHIHPNASGRPRLGITASRKVGGAVVRNRLKRWTRECYRRSGWRPQLAPLDLVVHFKPEAAAAGFVEFRAELERLLGDVVRRQR